MPNGALRQANLKMLFERAKEYEKTSFSGLFNFIRLIERLKSGSSDMSAAKVIGEAENVVRIMSIHKSKGLEFPVVFLCQANKKINLQDLKTNILLHKEVGFGPQYIDYERKIQYPTAAKQAIKIVGKIESIAEEMRILYVALTRAKEKLIVTGTVKNLKKEENKKEMVDVYQTENGKLNPILLKKYTSYWEWIQLVIFCGKLQEELEIEVHKKNEFETEQIMEKEERKFSFEEQVDFHKIKQIFEWEYPDRVLIDLPVKTTVSQIKEWKNKERDSEEMAGLQEIKARFAESKQKMTSARRGTLMHLVFQRLNFRKSYTRKELQDLIEHLVFQKIIGEEEASSINIGKIECFLKTEICKRMKMAKQIEKEKAFCMVTQLEELEGQEVAIQGIMDLYFIDQNDHLVLLDYKTDVVEEESDLKNKYFRQLMIYKKALEISLNRKVDEVYIYSTCLNQLIYL